MRGWIVAALLTATLPFAGVVAAQSEVRSEKEKQTARNLLDIGDEKFAASDFEGALKAYVGADAIMQVPTTTFEVGRCYERLGRLLEARAAFQRTTEYAVSQDEPEIFIETRKRAREQIAALTTRIPTLRIMLEGVAATAEVRVRVGGEDFERAALAQPREVNPGETVITASAKGYEGVTLTKAVPEGGETSVTLTLKKVTNVTQVSVDGPGYAVPLAAVGFVVAGVGGIVGAVTGGLSLSKAKDLQERCPSDGCPFGSGADIDEMNMLANVSNVSFAVAGVGAIAGVVGVTLLATSEETEQARLRVAPSGLWLTGSF